MAQSKEQRNIYLAEWRKKNRDKTRASQKKYYEANKEFCLDKIKKCQKAKKDKYKLKANSSNSGLTSGCFNIAFISEANKNW